MSDGDQPPVLTAALTALRDGFNQAFPLRDKTTDGWIGDEAHQATVSGHNPDDTAGVRAEYSDLDDDPEVRAIDVDKDLNCPGTTMRDVIDLILATPNDLMRLRYIIHDGIIWSKNNGWKPAPYTGVNAHTEHAHFSGDPLFDQNDSQWCVAIMGDNMPLTDADVRKIWTFFLGSSGPTTGVALQSAYQNVLKLASTVPSDLVQRLDAILQAAQDDGQAEVILPPEALATLGEILNLLKEVPTAEENADAVIAEIAS